MATTANCTINGIRARSKDGLGNGPYWFTYADSGYYGTSVDDSNPWGPNNGSDFVINPIISSPGGNNKYTIAIKVTTPNISGDISAITITCNIFRHGSSTGPVYASLRTTSTSNGSDTVDTFRSYAIGDEASVSGVVGSQSSPVSCSFTFYSSSLQPNTSYYLFLYTKSTSYIYAAYGNWAVCSGAYITYEEGGKVRIYTSSGWVEAIPWVYTSSGWVKAKPWVYTSSGWT